jgi:hypothetical protein
VSHAEGINAQANGDYSHAEGTFTTAGNTGAHIMVNTGDTNADYSWFLANGTNALTEASQQKSLPQATPIFTNAWINGMGLRGALRDSGRPAYRARLFCDVLRRWGKIRRAAGEDYILGAVSATPGVIGDSGETALEDKYTTDEWGRIQYHEVTVGDVKDKDGNVKIPAHVETPPVLNPDGILRWNISPVQRGRNG